MRSAKLPGLLRRTMLVSCAAALFAIQSHAGILFNYPNFSSTAGLTLVGSTTTATTGDGTVLRLTPANSYQSGAAYSTSAITLGPDATFSTTFDFRFTGQGGIDPADGITFVLAAASAGLGSSGGDIGYGGVPNSVAIEFDTFDNGGVDGNSSNHVAIDPDGNILNGLGDQNLIDVYGVRNCDFGTSTSYLSPGCMSNGDLWRATISYNGSDLSASLFDMSGAHAESAPFTVYSSLPLNIAADLGTNTAFVGFTSGTGGGIENHDIGNWQFANTTQLATPEPGTLVSLAGACAALMLARRRIRKQS